MPHVEPNERIEPVSRPLGDDIAPPEKSPPPKVDDVECRRCLDISKAQRTPVAIEDQVVFDLPEAVANAQTIEKAVEVVVLPEEGMKPMLDGLLPLAHRDFPRADLPAEVRVPFEERDSDAPFAQCRRDADSRQATSEHGHARGITGEHAWQAVIDRVRRLPVASELSLDETPEGRGPIDSPHK